MTSIECNACGYPTHTTKSHACEKCRAGSLQSETLTELLATAKDVTRMLEAVRYTSGLGKSQVKRLQKAQAVIAKAEGALKQ